MHHADVVELVDTLDSGSSACKGMKVQVLSSALKNPVVRYRVFRFFDNVILERRTFVIPASVLQKQEEKPYQVGLDKEDASFSTNEKYVLFWAIVFCERS